MCLVFIALKQHPDYPLIVAANRDEFYRRAASLLHPWPNSTPIQLYAGQDQEAGGTWLATGDNGRFAIVTNYREMDVKTAELSRGDIPVLWLKEELSAQQFSDRLAADSSRYSGFNCLFGEYQNTEVSIHYASNRTDPILNLEHGLYGLSNAVIDTPWPKVRQGKHRIQPLLAEPFQPEQWFDVLADATQADDIELPDTGIGLDTERLLSSTFIKSEHYGTRCSTLLTMDTKGRCRIIERSFDHAPAITTTHQFNLTGIL
ncbi:Uncharacterised protein [BD1-7 clade bacterium]|uniref:Transport and Golgi organization protein 2 n=1 Tax=BD1-7 clade bacterium TaxID=2029982 RepID=A0A5S9MS07_9GAMM|nr:Uncharacterised protein [BD1-7 clade bacterium]CAA0084448.1 Uncharacterised protein [BD1-7 clade bacterium]